MQTILSITKADPRYPQRLAQIHSAPEVLYCRGNIELLQSTCFAVVGTRKVTPYGREAAELIIPPIARNGFTIVSGLALGIDAIAHQATLNAGGKTIAVLGSGVNDECIGPKTNFELAMDILKSDGLIISEYPNGFPANDKTFPQRNRIISGLSRGVLIVEADAKSGSLITAACAIDQNRDVFAVPGPIFSPRSAGTNQLIQKGAKLVRTAQDILEEYHPQERLLLDQKQNLSTQNPVQEKILAILSSNGSAHADALIEETQSTSEDVIAALSILEVYGTIKQAHDGTYILCN